MDDIQATAMHEAAHAVVSYLLGIPFAFIEISGPREGMMMPFFSPCPICNMFVPEHEACQSCLEYFEKHHPREDARSACIERFYREEAAIAVAGELIETQITGGHLISATDELAWDQDRVKTRASLRHLWQAGSTPCVNYCGREDHCTECDHAISQLKSNINQAICAGRVVSALTTLAEELVQRSHISGTEVADLLAARGLTSGELNIETVWPSLA